MKVTHTKWKQSDFHHTLSGTHRDQNYILPNSHWGFPCGSDGKASAHNAEDQGSSLGWEDPLEKEMATHSSILAWKIPWTEEPGRLQSMECKESDMTE